MKQAGLAFVESFGVERVRQFEQIIIEMMAELVQQGAQKSAQRDDLTALRRAHPYVDMRGSASAGARVETVQLAPVPARSGRIDRYPYRRRSQALRDRVDQFPASVLRMLAVLTLQRCG